MPAGAQRPLLVVTDAGVDQDAVPPGVEHVAVEAHDDPVVVAQVLRAQPRRRRVDAGQIHLRQQEVDRRERPLRLDDPVDGELPEGRLAHVMSCRLPGGHRPRCGRV